MSFETIQLPHDDAGIRSYLDRYKAFRLLALKTAPEMFGSTYSRELAFTDEIWYNRLKNPQAFTFITVQEEKVVGTLTIVGPLPFGVEESASLSNPWDSLDGKPPPKPTYSHWRVNGMFTLPEIRGKGIAKILMERGVNLGREEALKSGKDFVMSIVVDADNIAAKTLYKKSGFVTVKEEPRSPGSTRIALLMEYSPGKFES
ncbi:hypothetical protein BGZ60DRAFT_412786 [Tricladium varicosporioides]|nr:hypothetical protein BGZ60DRAFT_412786 [Hymenoscyphus varicosporioides]